MQALRLMQQQVGISDFLAILVLPAVRILRGRPGTALVAADLGTQHF